MEGHVDAAAKREAVVDHHDLLMVAAAERVLVVGPEVEALAREPVEDLEGDGGPEGNVQEREIPAQDEDPNLRPGLDHVRQERAQLVRNGRIVIALEPDPPVEVPADQEHGMTSLQDGGLGRGEVGRGIADHGDAPGPRPAPAIASGLQDRVGGHAVG